MDICVYSQGDPDHEGCSGEVIQSLDSLWLRTTPLQLLTPRTPHQQLMGFHPRWSVATHKVMFLMEKRLRQLKRTMTVSVTVSLRLVRLASMSLCHLLVLQE